VPLLNLAPGVHTWLQEPWAHGRPNAGVVLEADGATVVDSLCTVEQAEAFAAEVEAFGFPIRRLVLTGDHIELVGGSSRFALAAVYGTAAASAHLDQPPTPAVYRSLFPDLADQFDDELKTRPVSHVVTQSNQFTPATTVLHLDGESVANLALLVPDAGVLFAGALCSFGVTPLAYDGDPARWADTLDEVADLAPIVVPGHGPLGGTEEVAAQAAYLRACVTAAGDPARIPAGPWDEWSGRRWDEVNVERAAMLAAGEDPRVPPPSMLRAVGLA
jgi:cyclase